MVSARSGPIACFVVIMAISGWLFFSLICASSTKEASVAYKSALMKKIYLHESMKKFIAKAKEDGQVEVCVIKGEDESKMGAFAQYGKLVFEMFYRCDLTTMGA